MEKKENLAYGGNLRVVERYRNGIPCGKWSYFALDSSFHSVELYDTSGVLLKGMTITNEGTEIEFNEHVIDAEPLDTNWVETMCSYIERKEKELERIKKYGECWLHFTVNAQGALLCRKSLFLQNSKGGFSFSR